MDIDENNTIEDEGITLDFLLKFLSDYIKSFWIIEFFWTITVNIFI